MNDPAPSPGSVTVPARLETPEEAALHAWFAEQALKSVDNLEAAARQVITLCTTLLGLVLALLALSDSPRPTYMGWSGVPWLGGAGVVALLGGVLCGLLVVLPQRREALLNDPARVQAAFAVLLAHKVWWLRAAVVCFGVALVILAGLVVLALVL